MADRTSANYKTDKSSVFNNLLHPNSYFYAVFDFPQCNINPHWFSAAALPSFAFNVCIDPAVGYCFLTSGFGIPIFSLKLPSELLESLLLLYLLWLLINIIGKEEECAPPASGFGVSLSVLICLLIFVTCGSLLSLNLLWFFWKSFQIHKNQNFSLGRLQGQVWLTEHQLKNT